MISGPNWMKHIVGCAVAAAGFCGLADSLTVGTATIGGGADNTVQQILRTDGKYAVVFINTTGPIAFTPAPGFLLEEALVVAGGGAGGGNVSAGGGAGGYLPLDFSAEPFAISGSATIVVGAGGQAMNDAQGFSGGNSTLTVNGTSYLAHGGGAGGCYNAVPAATGGSGGGGSKRVGAESIADAEAGELGNKGGAGILDGSNSAGGGGGGAGGPGEDATAPNRGGAGGIGCENAITGESLWYAGGGGGGGAGGHGAGGSGVGGNGGGYSGMNGRGGGGGGLGGAGAGGAGGSGTVILLLSHDTRCPQLSTVDIHAVQKHSFRVDAELINAGEGYETANVTLTVSGGTLSEPRVIALGERAPGPISVTVDELDSDTSYDVEIRVANAATALTAALSVMTLGPNNPGFVVTPPSLMKTRFGSRLLNFNISEADGAPLSQDLFDVVIGPVEADTVETTLRVAGKAGTIYEGLVREMTLPVYTRLEGVDGDGTAKISIPVRLTDRDTVNLRITVDSSSQQKVFGSRANSSSSDMFYFVWCDQCGFYNNTGNNGRSSSVSVPGEFNVTCGAAERKVVSVDGRSSCSWSAVTSYADFSTSYDLSLFTCEGNFWTPLDNFSGVMHSFSVTRCGAVWLDLLPCLRGEEIGFCDLKTGAFYGKTGTGGTFTAVPWEELLFSDVPTQFIVPGGEARPLPVVRLHETGEVLPEAQVRELFDIVYENNAAVGTGRVTLTGKTGTLAEGIEKVLTFEILGTLYAAPAACGTGDGSSWANASTLSNALARMSGGGELWLKAGAYAALPTESAFAFSSDIRIFGGFAGNEGSVAERTPDGRSVIDGRDEVNGLWVAPAGMLTVDRVDVVHGATYGFRCETAGGDVLLTNCVFSFSGSQGDLQGWYSADAFQQGGGNAILRGISSASLRAVGCDFSGGSTKSTVNCGNAQTFVKSFRTASFENCTFLTNRVVGTSGNRAVALSIVDSCASIVGCEFRGNQIGNGMSHCVSVYGRADGSVVRNCLFAGNVSNARVNYNTASLVMYLNVAASKALVENCTFLGNAHGEGATLAVPVGTVTVRNCIFAGNRDNGKPQTDIRASGATTVEYCLFEPNAAKVCTGASLDLREQTLVVGDPLFKSPLVGSTGTSFAQAMAIDAHLKPRSPAINTGDPANDWSKEPKPNGRRINMGAYGNTAEAACSPAGLVLMVR